MLRVHIHQLFTFDEVASLVADTRYSSILTRGDLLDYLDRLADDRVVPQVPPYPPEEPPA